MNRKNISIWMLSLYLILTVCFPALAGAPEGPEEVFCGLTADGKTIKMTAEEAARACSGDNARNTDGDAGESMGQDAGTASGGNTGPDTGAVSGGGRSQESPGAFAYTEEDLYVLAHQICGEAQNCSNEEQLYVGSVVLNRVNHAAYPNTVKAVVFQKGQYACTRDGNYYREPTAQNWANARYLLENGSVLPANVVYQSGKRQGHGVYQKTRYHYYCYY